MRLLLRRQPNGQVWSPQNDDRRYSESGKRCWWMRFNSLNERTDGRPGDGVSLPAVTDTGRSLGVLLSLKSRFRRCWGALNLTPIEVAQAFQTIAMAEIARRYQRCVRLLRKMVKCYTKVIRKRTRFVPAQAAYLTLWTMQQVVQRGTGRQLGAKYPVRVHLAGKKPGRQTTMSIPRLPVSTAAV